MCVPVEQRGRAVTAPAIAGLQIQVQHGSKQDQCSLTGILLSALEKTSTIKEASGALLGQNESRLIQELNLKHICTTNASANRLIPPLSRTAKWMVSEVLNSRSNRLGYGPSLLPHQDSCQKSKGWLLIAWSHICDRSRMPVKWTFHSPPFVSKPRR